MARTSDFINVVIASEALHRPEPEGFGAPHGVQGEAKQSPILNNNGATYRIMHIRKD